MATKERFPGQVDETHPEVFDIRAMPPQSADKKPGQLPESMVRQFFEEGYVVVESFFAQDELEPSRAACEELVDDLANMLHKAGKIKNLYKEYGLFQRLTEIEKEFPGATVLAIKLSGRLPQAFRDLWANPRLLNVVEQLVGPDIMGNPVWTLRPKVPKDDNTTVPWHQDAGYLDNNAYKVLQVVAWIPLLDATKDNGCIEVAARGHLKGKVATHQCCWRDTWYIMLDEKEMEQSLGVDLEKDVKLCPVPYGGMLLFSNMLPHRSLPNVSNAIRWSLDLRFQRTGTEAGFDNLLEGIVMRTKDNPTPSISWEPLLKNNRHLAGIEATANVEEDDPLFDTTFQGPWMKKWEMVNTNKHTARLA